MNDERNFLTSLPREEAPPPELRAQIAARLRDAGLLRRRKAPFAIAAAVAAIAAGVFFVVTHEATAPAAHARYILLLYESPQFSGGSREEYGAWAEQMQPLISGGEELASTDVLTIDGRTTAAPRNGSRLAGFFLIDANDDQAATRVARACPHIRHGGAVVLRRIVQ